MFIVLVFFFYREIKKPLLFPRGYDRSCMYVCIWGWGWGASWTFLKLITQKNRSAYAQTCLQRISQVLWIP